MVSSFKTTFVTVTIFSISIFILLSRYALWNPLFSSKTYSTNFSFDYRIPKWLMVGNLAQRTSNLTTDEELAIRLSIAAKHQKIILVWHKPTWYRRAEEINFSTCGNCVITFDKSKINDPATGAVMFHFTEMSPTNMPSSANRNPNQLHVFWAMESPPHVAYRKHVINSNYQFNATCSYRRHSDFMTALERNHVNDSINMNISLLDILKFKTKSALSMISNCGSNPAAQIRLRIIKRIRKLGYNVDGFGKCYKSLNLKRNRKDYPSVLRQYKFYMSFENSYHCRDYITEKVFANAFDFLSVPVVWGATKKDYTAMLPKGSFIFAEDFKTLESLVHYLKYLEGNDGAYLQYFEWHNTASPRPGLVTDSAFCQICRATHGINIDDRHRPDYDPQNPPRPTFTDGIAKRHIPSVKSYIFDDENIECYRHNFNNLKFYKDWNL